ncbi:MAG: molybdopterin oxidoreductase family protein [Pseudomonadota bacterium]
MNKHVSPDGLTTVHHSACPHDCPSCCALEVDVTAGAIGRVRGARENSYTDGVICAKVARYADRVNHPDRLTKPMRRVGDKGAGEWQEISWEDALDEVAEQFLKAEARHGAETVWPYYYAGTMGLVQRDSIHRLRHAKSYSGQHDTICINNAWSGFCAATGAIAGPDPREMALSDCVVIWGTNAVSTQVNVMTHAVKARKTRGAKIVVIDVYDNDTMKQADLALKLRPGTDGALACAVMHILFRDGAADRDFMARHADEPAALEAHLADKTPAWAAALTGLPMQKIEAFAALLKQRPRAYFRLGYGFTRSRNGASNMHAACCVPTVLGAWQYEGGGAFHNNADIYGLDGGAIKGTAFLDPGTRVMDQSKIGRVLTGDDAALYGGPPVTAMLVQNTNPLSVAPEQALVKRGFAREDLFCVVHEQFMTETAQWADIVLPATMFVEHDDVYKGGGHQYIIAGPKLVEGPGETRPNHYVIEELAQRLGVGDHDGFGQSEAQLIDGMLQASNRGTWEQLKAARWLDCQPDFETSHYANGFAHEDGKFHFRARWDSVKATHPPDVMGLQGDVAAMPGLPDHWAVIEEVDAEHPYRLATSPARSFLNTTFNETPKSVAREKRPCVFMHPDDGAREGLEDGAYVRLVNGQGGCLLHVILSETVKPGVLVAEGIWPNHAHEDGCGINTLTSAQETAPHGGAAFHDTKVRVERAHEA